MRTAIHYDNPEPTLTDQDVRDLQDWWDMEDRHLIPPAVPDGSWELWRLPLALLALVVLWTAVGGMIINYATTGRVW